MLHVFRHIRAQLPQVKSPLLQLRQSNSINLILDVSFCSLNSTKHNIMAVVPKLAGLSIPGGGHGIHTLEMCM
jgi:hypothetical protein